MNRKQFYKSGQLDKYNIGSNSIIYNFKCNKNTIKLYKYFLYLCSDESLNEKHNMLSQYSFWTDVDVLKERLKFTDRILKSCLKKLEDIDVIQVLKQPHNFNNKVAIEIFLKELYRNAKYDNEFEFRIIGKVFNEMRKRELLGHCHILT